MIKEGTGHHPHSLIDPKPIADFIEQHVQPSTAVRPEIVDDTFIKSHYYSTENSYIYLPKEDTYAACRGPDRVTSGPPVVSDSLSEGTGKRCDRRRIPVIVFAIFTHGIQQVSAVGIQPIA